MGGLGTDARTSALGGVGADAAGEEGAGNGGESLAGIGRVAVTARAGFWDPADLVGTGLVGVRVTAWGFFRGAGAGEDVGRAAGATAARGVRRAYVGAAGSRRGSEALGGAVGTAGMVAATGTTLGPEVLLRGEDFAAGGVTAGTDWAAGAGAAVEALTGGSLVRRTGVAWPAGAVAGVGADGGGVGTGSFFPVRGERDLGGMSRTLRDADHRLGVRLLLSLNWLSPAAQTVFPKVLNWSFRGLRRAKAWNANFPQLALACESERQKAGRVDLRSAGNPVLWARSWRGGGGVGGGLRCVCVLHR